MIRMDDFEFCNDSGLDLTNTLFTEARDFECINQF